jgi:importin subunit alpha-6/7
MSSKADRRKGFKKGIDPDLARRKREDTIIEIRKSKRDENLQKKRMVFSNGDSSAMEDSNRGGSAVTQQKVVCTELSAVFPLEVLTIGLIPSCVPQLESLPVMVQGVWSEDPAAQLEATTQFRKLLSIGACSVLRRTC